MLSDIAYHGSTMGLSFLLESYSIALLRVLSGVALGVLITFILLNNSQFQNVGIDTFVITCWQVLLIIAFDYRASLLMSMIPSRQATSLPIAQAPHYES